MNKPSTAFLLFSVWSLLSGASYSDSNSLFNDAEEHTSEVSVQVVSREVNAGDLKAGALEATFEFWVEAEADKVNLSCLVSDLNLGKDALESTGVKLDSSRGCRIEAANAYSIAGKNWELVEFKNERHKIDGSLNAVKSDYVTFRTIDATSFRRNVFVTLSWNRSSESRPVGNYEGAVKLIAEIPDNIHPAK